MKPAERMLEIVERCYFDHDQSVCNCADAVDMIINEFVLRERERCARLVENSHAVTGIRSEIAKEIRGAE